MRTQKELHAIEDALNYLGKTVSEEVFEKAIQACEEMLNTDASTSEIIEAIENLEF